MPLLARLPAARRAQPPGLAALALVARPVRAGRRRRRSRAQGLPDFTELVEKVGPGGGQHPHHRARPRAARGGAGNELDEDMLEFFRRFGMPGSRTGPSPRGAAAAATASRSRAASARASSSTPTAT